MSDGVQKTMYNRHGRWLAKTSSYRLPNSPVEGAGHDRVTGARVGEQVGQAGSVDGRAGLLIDVDPLVWESSGGECVELAFQALFGGRARVQWVRLTLELLKLL
jgi:hypothetical protein